MSNQKAAGIKKEDGVSQFFVFLCTVATLAAYYLEFCWYKPEKPDLFAFLFALIPPLAIVVIWLGLWGLYVVLEKHNIEINFTGEEEPKRLWMLLFSTVCSSLIGFCYAVVYSIVRMIQQSDWTFEHLTSVMGLALLPVGLLALIIGIITSGFDNSLKGSIESVSTDLQEFFGEGHIALRWHVRFVLLCMPVIVYLDLPNIFDRFL